jgi:hypothetical protein
MRVRSHRKEVADVTLKNLRPRDLAATFLVLLAAAYYGLFEAGVRAPEIGSARAVAAVVLFLGIAACATGAEQGVFRPGVPLGLVVRAQMLLGVAAFPTGVIAIALGSELMLTTLFALTAALWVSSTVRHLVRRPSSPIAYPKVRREVLNSGR